MPVSRMYSRLSRLRRRVATRLKMVVFPRRQHPRVYLATDVRVEGHGFTFIARSVQLGTQGMSLQYAGQLSTAQPVLLAFSLPSGSSVEVGAVVWWKTKELVGLRFDPRDHNQAIREWIERAAATLPACTLHGTKSKTIGGARDVPVSSTLLGSIDFHLV